MVKYIYSFIYLPEEKRVKKKRRKEDGIREIKRDYCRHFGL